VGAVLQQRIQDSWQPLAFFPRKLSPAQQKYSAYGRELLAIYEAVRYFRHVLEARHFSIITDHKPLTFAFHQKRDKCSPRQFNHLDFIAKFTTDICHISGQDNIVADALSRVEAITAPVTRAALAAAQEDELQSLLVSNTALQLEKLLIPGTSVELYCDKSSGKPRPYVPSPLCCQIFNSLHSLSHPGTKAMAKLVSQCFVWPAIQKDCRTWARACQSCQCSKVSRHTITPIGNFALPPAITTDQGRQFESQLCDSLAKVCGIHLTRTTPYHPAANGLAQRLHRTLKAAIMCHGDEQWTESLPLVLLGIRTAYKEDLQTSAAELVYGEPLRVPGELVVPAAPKVEASSLIQQLHRHMDQLRPTPAARYASPSTFVHKDLTDSTHVFLWQDAIRRLLEPPYSGPHKIIARTGKTFTIVVRG
jgi:hypothetical protein